MRWLPCLSNFLRANGAFTSAVALACCAWPLASAQPGPVAPIDFTFDAGFACPGFPLRVQTFGGRLLTFNRATGGTVTVIQIPIEPGRGPPTPRRRCQCLSRQLCADVVSLTHASFEREDVPWLIDEVSDPAKVIDG